MTQAWEFRGGCAVPAAGVPLSDRGFRYGMGLFETVRVRRGRPEFLRDHLGLLARSCVETGLPLERAGMPPLPALETIAAGLPDGSLRIIITAGDGGPCDPADAPRGFLFFEARAPLPDSRYEEGYSLGGPAPCDRSVHRHLKTLDYWGNLSALRAARGEGFDEVALAGFNGRLRGAAMANLFLFVDGRWITPPEADGARPGVVRARVIPLANAVERAADAAALASATAAFLTSSGLGVMPVRSAGGRRLPEFERAAAVWREFEGSDFQ